MKFQRINKRIRLIITGIVTGLIAAGMIGCSGTDKSSSENRSGKNSAETANFRADTVQVKTVRVRGKDFIQTLNATGTLNAKQKATIRAKVSGEVQRVFVDIGDRVRRGQTLLKIDPTDFRNDLKQAKAKLAQAKATLDNSKKEMKRMKGLYKAGSATEQNKDKAITTYRQVRANYQAAKAAKNTARQQLAYTSVEAPFDGVVTRRDYKQGDYATKGRPAAQVTNLSVLEAEMNIPEKYAGSIHKGLPVKLQFQSQIDSAKGKVTAVNPQIDTDSRTFLVKVTVHNSKHRLSDGLFFTASLTLPEVKNQPAVPRGAVQSDKGQDIVWMIRNGKAHRQVVQTGSKTEGWRMIIRGAKVGETVAVGGVGSLIDGYLVTTTKVDSLRMKN